MLESIRGYAEAKRKMGTPTVVAKDYAFQLLMSSSSMASIRTDLLSSPYSYCLTCYLMWSLMYFVQVLRAPHDRQSLRLYISLSSIVPRQRGPASPV